MQQSSESHITKSPERKKRIPLTDLQELSAIVNRIKGSIIDKTRTRATKLMLHEGPIIVGVRYEFLQTESEVHILHGVMRETSPERERILLEFDLKKLAAMLLRDFMEISGLQETRPNLRKALDWITGIIYHQIRISGDQEGLTSANIKGFENALNHAEVPYNALVRRGLNITFDDRFANRQLEKTAISFDLEHEDLTKLEMDSRLTEAFERRSAQNSEEKIYDLVYHPGAKITIECGGKKKNVGILEIIRTYLRISRKILLEKKDFISRDYDIKQIDNALDQVLGNLSIESDKKKIPQEIMTEIRRNISTTLDPILIASLRENITGPSYEKKKKFIKKK